MNEKIKGKYLAPKVKVIELRSSMVLCQSGGIVNMNFSDPIDGDYNF